MIICFNFFKKEKQIQPVHSDSMLTRASSLSGRNNYFNAHQMACQFQQLLSIILLSTPI